MSVYFDNRQSTIEITEEILFNLEKAVKASLELENIDIDLEVSISFVDNNEIQQLNNKYRGHNTATDVLSFPLIDKDTLMKKTKGFEILLGDIIISIPKAIEQSEEFGHSFLREITYLTIHGMFHLLGYDHINTNEKIIMREKENTILKQLEILR